MQEQLTVPLAFNFKQSCLRDLAGEFFCQSVDSILEDLVRDVVGGVGRPYSSSTKWFLDTDPRTIEFRKFVDKTPDLAAWFVEKFPYLDKNKIDVHILCCGIIFRLDGSNYGKFVDTTRIRSPGKVISYGTILNRDEIPAEVKDLIVVVNKGDGYKSERKPEEVDSTQMHEVLHVIFKRFFCLAPFLGCGDLRNELEKTSVDSRSDFIKLANRLTRGMLEVARSEIISYHAQGLKDPNFKELCGHFWRGHFNSIHNYLIANNISGQKRSDILNIFRSALNDYMEGKEKLYKWTRAQKRTFNNGPEIEYLVKLFMYDQFAVENVPAINSPVRSPVKLPQAA